MMSEDLFEYEVLTGENLSLQAVVDLHAISNVLSEFFDVPACTFVKNGFVFASALGQTSNDAYLKAFDCDPLSSFTASVGFSSTVDAETAKHLQSYAIPMIVAVDFDADAVDILTQNSETILVKLLSPLKSYKAYEQAVITHTPFGEIHAGSKNKLELENWIKTPSKLRQKPNRLQNKLKTLFLRGKLQNIYRQSALWLQRISRL